MHFQATTVSWKRGQKNGKAIRPFPGVTKGSVVHVFHVALLSEASKVDLGTSLLNDYKSLSSFLENNSQLPHKDSSSAMHDGIKPTG